MMHKRGDTWFAAILDEHTVLYKVYWFSGSSNDAPLHPVDTPGPGPGPVTGTVALAAGEAVTVNVSRCTMQ